MARPLIVRLPNWIGDVVMTLPALRLLAAHGYELQLVGKGWVGALLAAESWPSAIYPKTYLDRIRVLRGLAGKARRADAEFARGNAVLFLKSFSSALEMRLAGLRAFGYRTDMRRWLLQDSIPLPRLHKLLIYWRLATAFLDVRDEPPAAIDLRVTEPARARMAELQARQGLARYIVLCPFATGDIRGESKRWPWFAEFARVAESALGLPCVVCPAPGQEQVEARRHFGGAVILDGLGLSEYAALLQRAALVVANDTGPGHIAAAVGAPLISLFGASDPARYRPWGPNVTVLKEPQDWPGLESVLNTARIAITR